MGDSRKVEDITRDIVIPVALNTISAINPIVGILATFLYGGASVLAKWRVNRMQEISEIVGAEQLMDLLKRDDKTRDILHRILENVMDESSEAKRRLFYAYIQNLSIGTKDQFDDHTKLITVLNSITLEELNTLVLFANSHEDIRKQRLNGSNLPINLKGINVSEMLKHPTFSGQNGDILESNLDQLSNYGLIYAYYGRMDGNFYGPLKDFGMKFIEYISES